LYVQAVPEDKIVKNRVHVCLQPSDRTRDSEVDRLLLAACEAVQPDPVTLARTLFDRERHEENLDVF
jgi:hypothetical protein